MPRKDIDYSTDELEKAIAANPELQQLREQFSNLQEVKLLMKVADPSLSKRQIYEMLAQKHQNGLAFILQKRGRLYVTSPGAFAEWFANHRMVGADADE